MRNHLSPQLVEQIKDHDNWHWKLRSWLGTGTNMWGWNRLSGSQPSPIHAWLMMMFSVVYECTYYWENCCY